MLNYEFYAIKVIPLYNFPNRGFPNYYFDEINILNKLQKYDLILKLILSFHDYENLYLVSKLYEENLIQIKEKYWNENEIQFFSACIIQSLSNLRKEKIIYRDLHFDNLLFDKDFYIIIIDFHKSTEYKNKDYFYKEFKVMTPLRSPEIRNHLIYDYNSDYYNLGGMIYYIIFKSYFKYKKPSNKLSELTSKENKNYSKNLFDFVDKLLIINSSQRIGYKNIDELKNHAFFNNFSWERLKNRSLRSPFFKFAQNKTNSEFKKNVSKIINFFKNYSFMEKLNKIDITLLQNKL